MPDPSAALKDLLARHRARHPRMAEAAGAVAGKLAFLGDSIVLAASRYGEGWWAFGEGHCRRMLRLLGGDEARFRKAVLGYCTLSVEYLRLQQRLEKDGRYLLSTFAEANEKVYGSAEVMEGYYLDGLSLSLLFWPNHYGIFRFFMDRFVPEVPSEGRCLEVGTGNGIYTAALAGERPGTVIDGIDVSPHSLAYTRRMLEASSIPADRVLLAAGDIAKGLPFPDRAFSATVCGEVMEHLEDPGAALRELARVTRPGAPVFLNIAVFAANIDHIHLFRSVGEARRLVRDAGLVLGPELALAVRATDDPEARDVPVNYACVARRTP